MEIKYNKVFMYLNLLSSMLVSLIAIYLKKIFLSLQINLYGWFINLIILIIVMLLFLFFVKIFEIIINSKFIKEIIFKDSNIEGWWKVIVKDHKNIVSGDLVNISFKNGCIIIDITCYKYKMHSKRNILIEKGTFKSIAVCYHDGKMLQFAFEGTLINNFQKLSGLSLYNFHKAGINGPVSFNGHYYFLKEESKKLNFLHYQVDSNKITSRKEIQNLETIIDNKNYKREIIHQYIQDQL